MYVKRTLHTYLEVNEYPIVVTDKNIMCILPMTSQE